MKITVIFLGIIILALALPAIPGALMDFRTDTFDETFLETTAAAVTNTTVQLAEPLWDDSVAYATVVSNDTTEMPTPNSYNTTTRQLTITNLNANTSHILTVTYDSSGLDDYAGAEAGVKSVPTAIMASVIILPLALIIGFFVRRR